MRLSITTFKIFEAWDLDTLCRELPAAQVEGVEFRIDRGHKHGVETSLSAAQRQRVKEQLGRAGLTPCSIASGCMFHWPDAGKVRENIEGAKRAIELAQAIGAPRVRVFGNDVPPGTHPDDVAIQVGRALRELGAFAEPRGVEVLLEMHGAFNDWWLNRKAVEFANHRAVATLYNWDNRDLVKGSVASVWHEMKALIRHIHFHDLREKDYPHAEMFRLLAADGYSGFLSMEVAMAGDTAANLREQAEIFRRLRAAGLEGAAS